MSSAALATPCSVRSEHDPGLAALTFVLPGVTVEVEVSPAAVQGQVVPARPGRLRLEGCDGSVAEARVEVDGWFRFGPPPAGGFRLQVPGPGGRPVRTPWVGR